MSATNRGSERVEADFYPTPIVTIEKFLSHHQLLNGLTLEPSAGKKRTYWRFSYIST